MAGDRPPAEGRAASGRRAPAAVYLEAARPRTLTAAVVPVLVGTAAAEAFQPLPALLALVVAVSVQVGVNYANDYFDGIRGVDTEQRMGPRRAVASGLVPAAAMRTAMLAAFVVTALAGLALAALTTWWLVPIGLACLLAAAGYSGGPWPYASAGLGEVFVFAFFGLVATIGSQFVHDLEVAPVAVVAAFPVGALAVALLVVNNLRDIPTDRAAGKRTLAVRVGDGATRQLFILLVVVAFAFLGVLVVGTGSAWPLLPALALPLAARPLELVRNGATGPELVGVLGGTARLQLIFGFLLALGLALAGG